MHFPFNSVPYDTPSHTINNKSRKIGLRESPEDIKFKFEKKPNIQKNNYGYILLFTL